MSNINLTSLLNGLKYGTDVKTNNMNLSNITFGTNTEKVSSATDEVQLSNFSKRLSSQMSSFKDVVHKDTNQALSGSDIDSLISEEYINEFIEAGKKIQKPSAELDDLTWGMMVEIGAKVGITDPDILSELTVKDLEIFFYETNVKDSAFLLSNKPLVDENGNSLKQYTSKQDFWKEIFNKDSNGSVSRNTNFSIHILSTPDSGFSQDFFSNGSDKLLSELSTNSLHNFVLSLESKNSQMFRYTASTAAFAEKGGFADKALVIDHLKEGYNKLQSFMKKSPTIQAQVQKLQEALLSGSWVKFSPYS